MADGSVAAVPIGAGGSAARPGGLHRYMRRRSSVAVLMCLPLILLIAGLVIYPAIYAIYLSMAAAFAASRTGDG